MIKENEYVIAYTYKGQRRFEHIFARTPGEAQDLFRGRHSEHIFIFFNHIIFYKTFFYLRTF